MAELGAALAYMRLEGHRLGGNSFEASVWRSGGRHDNLATKMDACGTIRFRNTMVDRRYGSDFLTHSACFSV